MNNIKLKKDINIFRIKNIILDIDNVIFDSREWEKHIPKNGTREGWDEYHKYHYLVSPNLEMINFIKNLYVLKNIFFITSREDIMNMRNITINQLNDAFIGVRKWNKVNKYLFMRNACDYSPTKNVKFNILHTHIFPKFVVNLAIDDDIRNIEMYRENNIPAVHYTKFL